MPAEAFLASHILSTKPRLQCFVQEKKVRRREKTWKLGEAERGEGAGKLLVPAGGETKFLIKV